jgi:hypothetical protein
MIEGLGKGGTLARIIVLFDSRGDLVLTCITARGSPSKEAGDAEVALFGVSGWLA